MRSIVSNVVMRLCGGGMAGAGGARAEREDTGAELTSKWLREACLLRR